MDGESLTTCIGGPLDGARLRRSRAFSHAVHGQNGARYIHVYHPIVGKFFYLGVKREQKQICAPGRKDPA